MKNKENFYIFENNADGIYIIVTHDDKVRVYAMSDVYEIYNCFKELWFGKTSPSDAIANWQAMYDFTGKSPEEVNNMSREILDEFLSDPSNYPCFADKHGILKEPREDDEGKHFSYLSHTSAQKYLELLFADGVPCVG